MSYLATLQSRLRMAILLIGMLLLIVFLLQNTDSIPIQLLFFDGTIPTGVLILVTTLSGFVTGYYVAFSHHRQRHKQRIAREKEKALAHSNPEHEKSSAA